MKQSLSNRILAWAGIITLLVLFVLAVVFLLTGNIPMAITMIAANALLSIMIWFILRIHRNSEALNEEMLPQEKDDEKL